MPTYQSLWTQSPVVICSLRCFSIVEALLFLLSHYFLYKISFLGLNLQRRVGRFITPYFISSPSRMSPPPVPPSDCRSFLYILHELCSWFECCSLSGGHVSSARCSVSIVVGLGGGVVYNKALRMLSWWDMVTFRHTIQCECGDMFRLRSSQPLHAIWRLRFIILFMLWILTLTYLSFTRHI